MNIDRLNALGRMVTSAMEAHRAKWTDADGKWTDEKARFEHDEASEAWYDILKVLSRQGTARQFD